MLRFRAALTRVSPPWRRADGARSGPAPSPLADKRVTREVAPHEHRLGSRTPLLVAVRNATTTWSRRMKRPLRYVADHMSRTNVNRSQDAAATTGRRSAIRLGTRT